MMKSLRRFIALILAVVALTASAQWDTIPPDAVMPRWRDRVPQAVHPDSSLVALYNKAWETAAGRVRRGPEGMVASPYLDENCYDDQIWIWDGCFMVMFSKYAPDVFPGKETLMNYYAPIHDGAPSPLRIHLRDNPPLFAWVELQNYRFTGEHPRMDYLTKHYRYFNSLEHGSREPSLSPNPVFLTVHRDSLGQAEGYTWNGNGSGMDNTPRGRDAGGWDAIRWVDAISQQALAAKSIAELYELDGNAAEASEWRREYERVKGIINRDYWDERDGFYYDIDTLGGAPCRVMTPASFWAMMAEVPDSARAARMAEKLIDDRLLGGERPWTSLSRSDADFDSVTGNYWRGGIWLPMVYMGTKALERYGYTALADSLAERVVRLQAGIYENMSPHTIWETYSPVADAPSTEHGHLVRQEFCGWSALGPISLFIENIMGFRSADALNRTLVWDVKPQNGTHGLRRLRFGPIEADLIYDSALGELQIQTETPFTLIANGRKYLISAGTNRIKHDIR